MIKPAVNMKIAITGGIGSGKSYVCRLLEKRGIEVYDCDAAAKRLMRLSDDLRRALTELIGPDAYVDDVLQKKVIARFLLSDHRNAEALNNVVHPFVARDFMASGKDWIETAILFDSGFHRRISPDRVVCVTAPIEVRLDRIMVRDGLTRSQAQAWIQRQMPQDEVAGLSDYVIENDGMQSLDNQIDNILNKIYN